MPPKGSKKEGSYITVKCPCGKFFDVHKSSVMSGGGKYCSKNCMNKHRGDVVKEKDNLVGKIFGKLTVIEFAQMSKHRTRQWRCICECGKEKIIEGQSLKNGNTQSCGCLTSELAKQLPAHRHSRAFVPIVCGIYKITNPNGEVYIGGSRTIYRRWLRHREARKNIKIHLSIKEFGWKAHTFEIVHELPKDVDDETLIMYEQIYMDLYRDCGSIMLNVKDAGSKAKFSDESKKRMSIAQRGKTPWNKGVKGGNAMAENYKQNNL